MSQKFTDKPRIRVCVENGQMRGILLVRRWGYGNLALCHGVNISVVFVLMFSKAYSPPNIMLGNGRTGHTCHIVEANFMLVNTVHSNSRAPGW